MSNQTTVIGNLAADPELRFTPKGVAVVSLRVADTPRNLDRATNQWVDGETDWISVTAWDDLAQNIAASFKKGHKVIVIGSYKAEKYTDKNTNEQRSTRKLVATEVSPSLTGARVTIEKVARSGRTEPTNGNSGYNATPSAAPTPGNAEAFDDTPF